MENSEEKDCRGHEPVMSSSQLSGQRRLFSHDYREAGTYMVTMLTEGRKKLFGHLEGTVRGKAGSSEAPHIVLSELGRQILEQKVPSISRFSPQVEVSSVVMMPDHIHLLLRVMAMLPDGMHLGQVVRRFKDECNRALWALQDAACPLAGADEAPHKRPNLFENGYYDRLISRPDMFDCIKRYMQENPLRARMREECHNLFERRLHLWICGREYAAFGNLFLLKYPLKEQVFFHRYTLVDNPDERQAIQTSENLTEKEKEHILADRFKMPTHLISFFVAERERLLKSAEGGTVLVTPGISKGERIIVNDAINAELPLILLQARPIGPYWRPEDRHYFACATGQLLILSPWQMEGISDYELFHRLNDFAHELCEGTDARIIGYSSLLG